VDGDGIKMKDLFGRKVRTILWDDIKGCRIENRNDGEGPYQILKLKVAHRWVTVVNAVSYFRKDDFLSLQKAIQARTSNNKRTAV
jgi:hypothetical protein